MTQSIKPATFAVFLASGILAQPTATPPAFEVASIKPASPDAQGMTFGFPGAEFRARNHTLKECIGFAYNLTAGLISGGPSWIASDRYDIEAKIPGGPKTPRDQTMLMVQTLLADRFKLKFHREQKQMSVYNLVVGKNGLKITESAAAPDQRPSLLIRPSPNRAAMLPAHNATMAEFVSLMQRVVLDRPVIDKTGLTGKYDFNLEWAIEGTRLAGGPSPPGEADSASKPDIFSSIQQLGLKFEPAKGTVETVVIDYAEKPGEN